MPRDEMKKLTMESGATGPLYGPARRRRFRGRHLLIVLLIAGAGFGIYSKLRRPGSKQPWSAIFVKKTVFRPVKSRPVAHGAVSRPAAPADPFEIRHITLHSGDTPGKIFERLNIPRANLKGLRKAWVRSPFDSIRNNDELFLVSNRADGQPVTLVYLRSGGGAYAFRKNRSGWECGPKENSAAVAVVSAHGVFSKSFYHTCVACGLPAPLILRLADIFSCEVDVASDFKEGDSFSVFFQKYPIASSREKRFLILAAQVDVSGKIYQAIGFQLPDGSWDYFDPSGASIERQFSKVPLNYRTLLQKNGRAVLRVFRPRFEIMYIVPAGAEVCAIGEGVVYAIHRFGHRFSIEIRHSGGYISWYGNLSACRRGLRRGTPVSRSMVIGSAEPYGSGKAFFDFRLYRNGKRVNFATSQFAPVSSVPETMQAEFAKTKAVCLAALRRESMAEIKREIPSGKK